MKKKLAAALAALMVLSMGTTAVFAANSPDTSTDAGLIEEYLEFYSSYSFGTDADTVVCVGTISGTGVYVSPEDEEGYWTELTPSTDVSLNEDITLTIPL